MGTDNKLVEDLNDRLCELIRDTATKLPPDVTKKIKEMKDIEEENSNGKTILDIILNNIDISKDNFTPICQDTGTLAFYINKPCDISPALLDKSVKEAIICATEKNYLRPNSVDPITGENPGTNLGKGFPLIFIDDWDDDKREIEVNLMLKGGGCENVSSQYSLPDVSINAGRDIKGIKNAILHGIYSAQGRGCAPGIIGVGIGGDRAHSYLLAKKQLFRKLEDQNPDPILAEMENEIYDKANLMEIGPMGLGGKTTVLGVKIGKMMRIPASFFVSISYSCWATRRYTLTIKENGYEIQ